MDKNALGPAEHIISALLTYQDHMVHNRPGMVTADARSAVGLQWFPVTHKEEEGKKVVYRLEKVGKKSRQVKVGVLREDGRIFDGPRKVGEYRPAGVFPEVAVWMYSKVAEVWKLDNEFSARWASYAFKQEHRDLKVVLAAFMLVQSRKGDPVRDGDKVAFNDEDFRSVGEAMCLLMNKDNKDFDPKLLIRIRQVLELAPIAEMNRELGFGRSAKGPFLGRWRGAVDKWLRYREQNPKMLEGLVKAGWRTSVMDLASMIGYKPEAVRFYQALRWKQKQATDGRREVAIGMEVSKAESWEGLSEQEICERITKQKPSYKRIVALLSAGQLTRAIMAAAIDARALSDKDLVIATPTLEELGLLKIQEYKLRWENAVKASDDMRAANIATRVKSKETAEKLQEGAEIALKKAVAEASKNIRAYIIVDISSSMQTAIKKAKEYLARFLPGFTLDNIHVSVFNTAGRVVEIKHASAAGIENAFHGINASGGTNYAEGVRALERFKPKPDEDVVFIFVGDEEASTFAGAVRNSGLNPMAFGFVKIGGETGNLGRYNTYEAVVGTARELSIPCFMIDEQTFADPYAVPRTMRALIAATPVNRAANRVVAQPRATLIDLIINTPLLAKPAWA